MLRSIKHPHLKPRLLALEIDGSSGTPAASKGVFDVASVDDNGVGDYTVNFAKPFADAPLVFMTCFTAVDTGAEVFFTGAGSAAGSVRFQIQDSAGAPADGKVSLLVVGYESDRTEKTIPQTVKISRDRSRLLGLKVNADATSPALLVGKAEASLARDGVGQYTLTFRRAFADVPVVLGTSAETSANSVTVTSVSRQSVSVEVGDDAGAAGDIDFFLLVIGSDADAERAGLRRSLKCEQRKPRLLAFDIDYAAGVPSLARGSTDATINDDGTGQATLTLTEAFKRDPICLASSDEAYAFVEASSESALTLQVADGAGAAADPTAKAQVLVLGFDDPLEY